MIGIFKELGEGAVSCDVVLTSHCPENLSDEPPDERTADGTVRNLLPKEVIEQTWEVTHEKDEPDVPEDNQEETHRRG
jgi:hypothetical protein